MELKALEQAMQSFVESKGWYDQDSPHPQTPKNLAISLVLEANEVLEHFQWLTERQSRRLGQKRRREVERELADVQIYLIRLSQVLKIDLVVAASRKLVENAQKYHVSKAKGSMKKYTELA